MSVRTGLAPRGAPLADAAGVELPRVRIAIYGLSGSGKSTSAALIEEAAAARGLTYARLKLAEPLYDLQRAFYRRARLRIARYEQDQVLLETIAGELRRLSPTSLADDLEHRLRRCSSDVAVNDDLRDVHVDYPRLRALGFVFVSVVCDEDERRRRLGLRADRSVVVSSRTTSELGLITPDVVVDNSEPGIDALRSRLTDVLGGLL
jgi:hypothetical protein